MGTEPAGTAEAPPANSFTAGSDILAQAYKILLARLVLPIQPDALLAGAWIGAVAEARRQGVVSPPASPALGSDATAVHRELPRHEPLAFTTGSSPPAYGHASIAAD
ncbi:MAG TPA: hypothetical protein VK821_13765 [Dehalococcoidia bacterium]|nr:hypothetical protein [Dehalococcoidia bacterium]